MKPILPGHVYELEDGTTLRFRKEPGGPGATTCEILDVLMHRLGELNKRQPCQENVDAINHLIAAKARQTARFERIKAERKRQCTAVHQPSTGAAP